MTAILRRTQALAGLKVLLRRALAEPCDAAAYRALDGVEAEQLVATASAHGVAGLISKAAADPEIARRLDEDLVVFFDVLREKNGERNAALTAQLIETAALLTRTGIPVVALKGGAELLVPVFEDPSDRLLGDLDLLVPEHQIDAAIAALKAAGYGDGDRPYDRSKKHAPALWRETDPTSVEVHTAVSERIGNEILPAADVLGRAVPTAVPGLRVPCLADRLCHLVTHAQIDSSRYDYNLSILRDVAELHALSKRLDPQDWQTVRARFEAHGCAVYFDAFTTLAADVIGRRVDPFPETPAARAWTDKTWRSLTTPNVHRGRLAWQLVQWYGARLRADPSLALRLAAAALSPARVRTFIAHKLRLMRSYQ
jgi:hypothetical protein